MVIDGKVAFTGGINLADEYMNIVERFGYWKDTGVMLKGDDSKKLHVFCSYRCGMLPKRY
ncbi:cardiolipin synthetase [human gut metagenome]|uniref:Cardiolipin synthetase n=1 Tax=human gut metagenome TaxID=408170 RepID=K1SB73_9ZZZZ